MGFYSTKWKFDGVQAAFVTRGIRNGRYRVVFEREHASLEDIEGINWAQPTIERTDFRVKNELGLPEGYGFTVEGISYDYSAKSYIVELSVASQYLGDVTQYQSQIDELQTATAEKDSTISQQAATIQSQAETIERMEAGGTAETVKADLQAAYTEGVESNG